MPVSVLMPALSPAMEKGKLARWYVKEGDHISTGVIIAEIETDKATMEVEAIEEGRIARIYVKAGTADIAVNTTIALIETVGEMASGQGNAVETNASDSESRRVVSEQAKALGITEPAAGAIVCPPPTDRNNDRNSEMLKTSHPGASAQLAGTGRVLASPLARRIARERNVELAAIRGSGPGGRIVKKDILSQPTASPTVSGNLATAPLASMSDTARVAPDPSSASKTAAANDRQALSEFEAGSYQTVPHDNMRRVIAERLTFAKSTIPHFYLTIDCELDELLKARTCLNEGVVGEGVKLSVNDFIIKALALALKKVPNANASWTSDAILRHANADVAVAVAVEGGLFTPVVRSADTKGLAQISSEMKDFAERARSKRLAPHEYQGGTTSISNLGMYDIRQFEAVINPPHASILAVGRGEQRPVVRNGTLSIAHVMTCTLSCDHRVIDGALGAELLKAFKTFIESPVAMLA